MEDYILINFLNEHKGQKKWSLLAYQLKSRNENAIKNRYYAIIDKKTPRYCSKKNKKTELQKIQEYEKELVKKNPHLPSEFKER